LFLFLQEYWSASIVKNKKFSEEEKIIELLFLFLQEYWSASVVKNKKFSFRRRKDNKIIVSFSTGVLECLNRKK
jgi:hypothetical protein